MFTRSKKRFSVSRNDISDIYSDLCFANFVFFFNRNARLIVQAQEQLPLTAASTKMSRSKTLLREIIDSNHRKLNRHSRFAPPKTNTLKHLQNEFRKTIPRPRYAFVTLVMCGDDYVKEALTLAWSLRQQKTMHELIVME